MSRELIIDGRRIADDEQIYGIAEASHNHGGELKKAFQMVDSAIEAGASAVKFQTRHPEEVYSPAEYNRESDNPQWMADTYGAHREKLEFTQSQWEELFAYCKKQGIPAFSTPFDFKSVDQLDDLGVPAFKVASGDATNHPMLEYIASKGKPMIISTGGSTQEEVDWIFKLLDKNAEFALNQCSCIYPAPDEVLDLNVITTYRQRYPDVVIGFSTHTPTIYPALAAVGLGARMLEHHYTNDREWKGTDNHFSLTPTVFKELVDGSNQIIRSVGTPEKYRHPIEDSYTIERRKSLYWADDMEAQRDILPVHVKIQCPGNECPPYDFDVVTQRSRTSRAVKAGEPVQYDDFESSESRPIL